jgi:hypothetical protein
MASVLETSGALENVNDEYSNTKLAKLFEKLYDNQWVKLSEWLEENNSDLSELERVKALSTLMKVYHTNFYIISIHVVVFAIKIKCQNDRFFL